VIFFQSDWLWADWNVFKLRETAAVHSLVVRMSHIYRSLVLISLLRNNAEANVADIAKAFLAQYLRLSKPRYQQLCSYTNVPGVR
jgi:hypothetical protein